jgi:hypothetical protein
MLVDVIVVEVIDIDDATLVIRLAVVKFMAQHSIARERSAPKQKSAAHDEQVPLVSFRPVGSENAWGR